MRPRPPASGFTAESTRRTLRDACATLQLGCADVELIRLGENAIYALPEAGVVVRIARGRHHLADVEKELRVARWLADADVPATRPTSGLPQPYEQDGVVLTFWDLIRGEPAPALDRGSGVPAANVPLARARGRPQPAGHCSPWTVPRPGSNRRTSSPRPSAQFLLDRRDELADAFDRLEFVLPPGPIHGDAHRKNLLRDVDGVTHLLDFEMVAWGPREWDLSLTGGYRHSFGWITASEYDAFAATYGYDVTEWPGFAVLHAIRELTMTTWLMQNVRESPKLMQEFRVRLRDLADDSRPRHWTAF